MPPSQRQCLEDPDFFPTPLRDGRASRKKPHDPKPGSPDNYIIHENFTIDVKNFNENIRAPC